MKIGIHLPLGLLFVGLLFTSPRVRAAIDMFMRMDGIEGESQDAQHRDEIDVLAWSWGMSNPASQVGGTAGRVRIEDLKVTKYVDKASPELMLRCSNGQRIPEVILTFRRAGPAGPREFFVITMRDVMVTSVSISGSGTEARFTENVSLNFSRVTVYYTPYDASGEPQPPVTYQWDIEANREF